MKELFEQMRRLCAEGGFVLTAIIDSSGSSPRGPGALMLSSRNGRAWGSIGGALAEHRALEDAAAIIARQGGSSLITYELGATPSETGDAVCGGEITVYSVYCDSADAGLKNFIEQGIESFGGERAWLLMEIAENAARLSLTLARKNGIVAHVGAQPADAAALLADKPGCQKQDGRTWFSLPLSGPGFVYIFGGGHVAQELVPLLSRLDFRCVVFDDRAEFTRQELFPDAVRLITGDFSRIGDSIEPEPNDYVVIVTRGHQWDFHVESFALRGTAAYIGVIGSLAKHAFIEQRLRAEGFTPEQIHAPRVHAPIGVAIGSKTPAEVAVSIAAELIGVRSMTAATA
jgi:xanthine dehydrogenase accessory factor